MEKLCGHADGQRCGACESGAYLGADSNRQLTGDQAVDNVQATGPGSQMQRGLHPGPHSSSLDSSPKLHQQSYYINVGGTLHIDSTLIVVQRAVALADEDHLTNVHTSAMPMESFCASILLLCLAEQVVSDASPFFNSNITSNVQIRGLMAVQPSRSL